MTAVHDFARSGAKDTQGSGAGKVVDRGHDGCAAVGLRDQNRSAVSAETWAAGVLFLVFWVFDRLDAQVTGQWNRVINFD